MRKRIMLAGLLKAALWTALMTTTVRAAVNEERFFENGNLSGIRNSRGLQQLRESLPATEFVFDAWRVVELPYRWLTVNEKFELARVGSVGYRDSHKSLVQELTRLLEHPTVEQIDLRHTSLTDDDLKIVAQMSNLKDLDIGNTKITAAGVQHLAAA